MTKQPQRKSRLLEKWLTPHKKPVYEQEKIEEKYIISDKTSGTDKTNDRM